MKIILGILILIGCTFNAYLITSKELSNFAAFNYLGVIVFPIGAVMGYVGIANKFGAFDQIIKEKNEKRNIKK